MKDLNIIKECANYIMRKIDKIPDTVIVLGSGLGMLTDYMKNKKEIKYDDLPNFPVSTVEGHDGRLITGDIENKSILAMKGRFHYYEGYSMDEVVFPIRVFLVLGIKNLIVTNAAGGINSTFNSGDLMVMKDHIKFFDDSPLRGKNIKEFGPRFNDMSDAYSKKLRELVKEAAYELDIPIHEGVYGFMPGPSYETPSEIKMLSMLGADAVGMSTVPEVITAAHGGMNILGITCITNMAAGITDKKLSHEEVIQNAAKAQTNFIKLLKVVIYKID